VVRRLRPSKELIRLLGLDCPSVDVPEDLEHIERRRLKQEKIEARHRQKKVVGGG